MFAVIRTGGKQYKVAPDTYLQVEKLDAEVGSKINLSEVLMIVDGDKTTVGAPVVAGDTETAEIHEQGRVEKVIIFKKRRRQNNRRKNGHRQMLTTIKITDMPPR